MPPLTSAQQSSIGDHYHVADQVLDPATGEPSVGGGGGISYVQAADPGAVGANTMWLQVVFGDPEDNPIGAYNILWLRDATDTAWVALGPAVYNEEGQFILASPQDESEVKLGDSEAGYGYVGATLGGPWPTMASGQPTAVLAQGSGSVVYASRTCGYERVGKIVVLTFLFQTDAGTAGDSSAQITVEIPGLPLPSGINANFVGTAAVTIPGGTAALGYRAIALDHITEPVRFTFKNEDGSNLGFNDSVELDSGTLIYGSFTYFTL